MASKPVPPGSLRARRSSGAGLGSPDQGDAAVIGDVEPFVRVGRPGVRVGQAGGQVRTRGISQRPQPERAVGMHPRPALPGPLDDVGEGIERAGVHLARLHADHRRAGHVLREPVGAHPPLVIGGHPADPVPAEPDQPEGLDQRGMGFLPAITVSSGAPDSPSACTSQPAWASC